MYVGTNHIIVTLGSTNNLLKAWILRHRKEKEKRVPFDFNYYFGDAIMDGIQSDF